MTETTATVTCHDPRRFRVGTVGTPIGEVEVRISDGGEILVRGETVMRGYWGRPAETAASFADGWLRTGDAGVLEDGYLRITDRIKDLMKTSGGRYVPPQRVEAAVRSDPLVEQAVAVGDGRPFVVALVVPAFEALEAWARAAGLAFAGRDALVRLPQVVELYRQRIAERTADLAPYERPARIALLAEPLRIEEGELTATLKVRRRAVAARYAERIEALYRDGA